MLKRPESEKVKVGETRSRATVGMLEVVLLQPIADPEDRTTLIGWAYENTSTDENLFLQRLNPDYGSPKDNPPFESPRVEAPGRGMMLWANFPEQ